MQQKFVLLILLFSLVGCSSRGPMHSYYGPAVTPDYTKILAATLYKNKKDIDFVASAHYMAKNHRNLGGAITITSGHIMFSQWNIDGLRYSPVLEIPIDQIKTYGRHLTLSVPVGLFTSAFYITTDHESYYFASKQIESIYYYIRTKNKTAIRIDE